jgi:spore maturation protein CgeB
MTQKRLLSANSPLRRLRRLPKLCNDELCVLLVENGYHLQRECKASLERMGHKVVSLVIGEEGATQPLSGTLDGFMRAVVEHQPDMLLSIDCLGFDTVNWMAEIVDAVGLPTAVWYVDSPMFIGYGFLNPAPNYTTIFSWDRSYLPVLNDLGCARVEHLPLATDLDVFHPMQTSTTPFYPISFVGNTLQTLEARWHARLAPDEHVKAEGFRQAILADRQALAEISRQAQKPVDRNMLALAYANFRASKLYRHHLLRALPQHGLHVFGDAAWRMLLPRAHTHDGFAYGPRLAEVFRASQVNFNATNLQMPTTVNQRVFDVPACGGLLLTDNQQELELYFEPGSEVLVYSCNDQAHEMARYYSQNPNAGANIIERAHRRVKAEHTYDHRIAKLIGIMRQNHRRGAAKGPQNPHTRSTSAVSPNTSASLPAAANSAT